MTGENCFVAVPPTKHGGENSNDFRERKWTRLRRRPAAEPGWASGRAGRFPLWTAVNPIRFPRDLRDSVQLCGPLARYIRFVNKTSSSAQGSAVVGNGNNDVGSDTARRAGKPIVEQMQGKGSSGAGMVKQMQAGQPTNCGAMSQQGSFSYHGNVSSPQQLLHLVGCRDPRVRSEPQVRTAPQRR